MQNFSCPSLHVTGIFCLECYYTLFKKNCFPTTTPSLYSLSREKQFQVLKQQEKEYVKNPKLFYNFPC